jgi:RNA polymerase sigma factor (sigma-70 family)
VYFSGDEDVLMPDVPTTPPSLLYRLRDSRDRDAWQQFVELYGPLIYRFGRKRGLQDADAADLTQIVFQAVTSAIGRFEYDPQRVKFRSWLYAVVRNHYCRLLSRRSRSPAVEGGTDAQEQLQEQPERENGEAALWEQEYRRGRFLWAADKVRGAVEEASWQAFWQTAVEGRAAAEVAAALGMNVGAVYTAKSRVLERIRRVLEELEDE